MYSYITFLCVFGVALSDAAPCDISGVWTFSNDTTMQIKFSKESDNLYVFGCLTSCPRPNTWWSYGYASFDELSPYELALTFQPTNTSLPMFTEGAILSTTCDVLYWQYPLYASPHWCGPSNPKCEPKYSLDFWKNGVVHVLQTSHSDIGWLGLQNDLEIDSDYITVALDYMRMNPSFTWQSECMLFLRSWVEMFPNRIWEVIQRMQEGRFDIGATFTEGYESSMVGEVLVRQVYQGRKWFVDNFPGIDSAVVAFHQDGPLRAIQTPQVFSKSGIRYFKFSRFSDRIFRWKSPDGSSMLAYSEIHYCYNGDSFDFDVAIESLSKWEPKYQVTNFPPYFPFSIGCDYQPPMFFDGPMSMWSDVTNLQMNVTYSNYKTFLDALSASNAEFPEFMGERPNLWVYETAPPHHRMWDNFRQGGRLLPKAETLSLFCSLLSSFSQYPEKEFFAAWRNLTLNDHGIAGEPVPKNSTVPKWVDNENSPDAWDELYFEKFNYSRIAAEKIIGNSQNCIIPFISIPSSSVVVFNTLSWNVTEPVETEVPTELTLEFQKRCEFGFETKLFKLSAPDSSGIPCHFDEEKSILKFVASNVPGFGYSTFRAQFSCRENQRRELNKKKEFPIWNSTYTNKFFRITPTLGGIKSMIDIQTGKEIFDTTYYAAGEWINLYYDGYGASETREIPSPYLNSSTFQRLSQVGNPVWRLISNNNVSIIFATDLAKANHTNITVTLEVYHQMKRVDFRLALLGWDDAFAAVNRLIFPIKTNLQNVTYSAPFGVVRVGHDENENGVRDVWNNNPGCEVPPFDRAWKLRPRELQDWIHAKIDQNFGVMFSSSVGVWDWKDVTGKHSENQPILQPELLLHTNSNRGPFLAEPGDHFFSFSLFVTDGNWAKIWRKPVQANNPLSTAWNKKKTITNRPTGIPTLPASFSFMKVSGENTWVTALKKKEQSYNENLTKKEKIEIPEENEVEIVARVFDTAGVNSNVSLVLNLPSGYSQTDFRPLTMIEEEIPEKFPAPQVYFDGRSNMVNVGKWSIETLCFTVSIANNDL